MRKIDLRSTVDIHRRETVRVIGRGAGQHESAAHAGKMALSANLQARIIRPIGQVVDARLQRQGALDIDRSIAARCIRTSAAAIDSRPRRDINDIPIAAALALPIGNVVGAGIQAHIGKGIGQRCMIGHEHGASGIGGG